jgi:hyperosmotically inducible protein
MHEILRFPAAHLLAALLLALLSSCTPTRTTKSVGEQIDDSLITARVKTELASKLGTGEAIRTDVETFRGRVQLNGFVDAQEKRDEAMRIARDVRGVAAVDNNLQVVSSGRSSGEFVDDNVLTAKIKAPLAEDPRVAAHEVNIDVRSGVVLLAGFVDNDRQKERAGEVASKIAGVERVDNPIAIKRR